MKTLDIKQQNNNLYKHNPTHDYRKVKNPLNF
jgi:hypothetical protein